jgi:hypothetical protein
MERLARVSTPNVAGADVDAMFEIVIGSHKSLATLYYCLCDVSDYVRMFSISIVYS